LSSGVFRQSGGHRGSLSPKLTQLGEQLGLMGLAEQGHLSSLPVNLLQSAGHLGLVGFLLQSIGHRGSSLLNLVHSGGHRGLRGSNPQSGRQRTSSMCLRQSGGHTSLKGSFSQSSSSSRDFGFRQRGSILATAGSLQEIGPPNSSTPSKKGSVVVSGSLSGISVEGDVGHLF